MFAVIATGGKQYAVKEGQVLTIEKIETEIGKPISFDALLVSDEEGKALQVGTPTVKGVKVTAKVLEHGLGEKITIVKFKPKVRYRRHVGHRQPFTKIQIEKITA